MTTYQDELEFLLPFLRGMEGGRVVINEGYLGRGIEKCISAVILVMLISATFTAILKITLPQCNAIKLRIPPVPALSEVLY